MLKRIGRKSLSGLAMVGNLLDVPGSIVRDLAGGEGLSGSFDQLLSPLSPDNRLTGRDLLTRWGLTKPNDPNRWEGADFGGFAAEVALDPLTYLTFGASALTKGGQVAKRAGLLPGLKGVKTARGLGPRVGRMRTSLEDLIATSGPYASQKAARSAEGLGLDLSEIGSQKLGGVVGVGLPFRRPSFVLGKEGGFGEKFAGKLDRLGERITYSRPGRTLGTMFDPGTMNTSTEAGQRFARGLFPRIRSAEQHVIAETTDTARKLQQRGSDTPEAIREQGRMLEAVSPVSPEFEDIARAHREEMDYTLVRNAELGLKPYRELEDVIDPATGKTLGYRPRQASIESPGGRPVAEFSTSDRSAIGRQQVWKGFAKGSEGVNELLTDEDLTGLIELGVSQNMSQKKLVQTTRDLIAQKYGQDILPTYQAVSKSGKLAFTDSTGRRVGLKPETVQRAAKLPDGSIEVTRLNGTSMVYKPVMQDRYKQLAMRMIGSPNLRGKRLFDNPWLVDSEGYRLSAARRQEIADYTYDWVADQSNLAGSIGKFRQAGDDRKTLSQFFRALDLDVDTAAKNVLERRGMSTAAMDDKALKKAIAAVKKEAISDETYRALTGIVAPATKPPESIRSAVEFADSITNLFKVGVLTWPARYVRDITSALARTMETGSFSLRGLVDSFRVIQGRTIPGAAKIDSLRDWMVRRGDDASTITDDSATEALRNIYAAFGPGGRYRHTDLTGVADELTAGAKGLENILERVPGQRQESLLDIASRTGRTFMGRETGTTFRPPGFGGQVRGAFGAEQHTYGPAAAGDIVGRITDDAPRLTALIAELRRGADPEAAMREIARAQVDYSPRSFTRFERTYLKRLFPFYSFISRQIPWVAMELARQPGGRLAQTIRAANRARGEDATTPEYVAQTTSIPFGTTPEGSQRYITGLGLMHESPLAFLGGDVFRSPLMEAASQMNPLLKAPAEWATGESFFQRGPMGGRDIEDLDPTIGRTLANVTGREDPVTFPGSKGMEFILGNSPLARALTSLRTATDTRRGIGEKALQLGTGIRSSLIAPAAQDAIIREQASAIMKDLGAKEFSRVYFPQDDLERMSPEQQEQALLFQGLQSLLARRAKERKRLMAF